MKMSVLQRREGKVEVKETEVKEERGKKKGGVKENKKEETDRGWRRV